MGGGECSGTLYTLLFDKSDKSTASHRNVFCKVYFSFGGDKNLMIISLFSEPTSDWHTLYLKLNVRELFNLLERH